MHSKCNDQKYFLFYSFDNVNDVCRMQTNKKEHN